jgi:hypothetical protein
MTPFGEPCPFHPPTPETYLGGEAPQTPQGAVKAQRGRGAASGAPEAIYPVSGQSKKGR